MIPGVGIGRLGRIMCPEESCTVWPGLHIKRVNRVNLGFMLNKLELYLTNRTGQPTFLSLPFLFISNLAHMTGTVWHAAGRPSLVCL